MRSRPTLTDRFSTFLQFEGDHPQTWVPDGRLQRSMQRSLQQHPRELSENFWALFWFKVWHQEKAKATPSRLLSRSLSTNHLAAYLQESCYWSAKRMLTQFSAVQYTVADCFQGAIVRMQKILEGFDPNQGFSLESYASAIFSSTIRDTLRQRQEIDICSNWALLRKVSQKRVIEALQTAGQSANTIQAYVLVWQEFKRLYVPTQATGTRKLPPPSPEIWQALAQTYDRERGSLPEASAVTLERWLNATAQAVRVYLNPNVVSINTPKPGQDSGELLDDLTDEVRGSLMNDLIAQEEAEERKTQQQDVNQVLVAAIADCDGEIQKILQLYYGEGQTQQQMAAQLAIKQYTISRRLTRAKEILLKKLILWSRDTLHIEITPDVIDTMGTVLEEWLQKHYQA
ncbi:sigma-70 family RNA polymerase sigma factor [Alkalinema sp. FACHB-956]|uniref:sigma-70 family RNA polymerase sigma factor n=1 Tax=Alkalinema sp. FACHB-956 TaxID=2692768 RepID=UPI00168307E9|nr:sigma-70 family RNA polymerase sigma factor [Alkalinema sp. FACHB-956]MBD2326651.1 sigma-70 family RNA polymerase sigma factor [Alkalinema sp. FACHB-956]